MIDLFQDRRIFVNSKKKAAIRNILPQLKYSPVIPRKAQEEILLSTDNSRIVYTYQPLSNILVSKKITPPNPEQITLLISKKRTQLNPNFNFKVRKESVKRIKDEQNEKEKQHRESTSLSNRNPKGEIEQQLDQIQLSRKTQELTFAVVQGNNNEDLVRQILLDRKIWKQIKFGEGIANLKWIFYKDRHNYKKMWSYTKKRIINHFEFNHEISTKNLLIKNLQIYCETKKMEMFTITPITFLIDFEDQYCEYNIKQFLNFFTKNDPRKNGVKRNNLPWSFVSKFLPFMGWQNSDIKKKVNMLSRPINTPTYYSEDSYLWLLKPTGLNRGRGIEIFDSLDQLQKILLDYLELVNSKKARQKQEIIKSQSKTQNNDKSFEIKQIKEGQTNDININNQSKFCGEKFNLNSCSFVIQKYVEKPFLIENRKFDIRVWTLLTENLTVYFFKQGYLRTSTEQFSTNNIDNLFIHLTNNAIQKYSSNYGQFQNANQLSFLHLRQYMSQQEVKDIWQKIKQITYMTFSSVKKKINPNNRKHCFEIFGLDYIIDAEKKVWLIQVNENPCIQCSSPLLGSLIPRMLNDAFKLTVDVIVERKGEDKPYPVEGYADSENMWQSLGQLMPNSEYSPKR